MNSILVYEKYISVTRAIGWAPYLVNPESKTIIPLKNGKSYWHMIINICYLAVLWGRCIIYFICVLASPDAEAFHRIIGSVAIIGVPLLSALQCHNYLFSSETAGLISALVRMEGGIPGLAHKPGITVKFWKTTAEFVVSNIRKIQVVCAFIFAGFYIMIPRLPFVIHYIIPTESDHFFNQPTLTSRIANILVAIPDALLFPIGWGVFISFDILLILISAQILIYINHTIKFGTPKECVVFLKQIRLLMRLLNAAFANTLVIQSFFTTIALLLMFYGSLISRNHLGLFLLFLVNSILLVVRVLSILLLLSHVDGNSKLFLRKIKGGFVGIKSQIEMNIMRREILALRPVHVSSGGIYKIDYDCVANYIEFLSSYVVFVVKLSIRS